jgi:hypothetical protein
MGLDGLTVTFPLAGGERVENEKNKNKSFHQKRAI